MTKEELLKRIKNPLDNKSLLKHVLDAYYQDESIYNYLTRINIKEKDMNSYYQGERDSFNVYLFNIWKNNILNYNISYIKDEYKKAFAELQTQLKSFDPKTDKQIREFMFNTNKIHSKDLEDFLEDFAYTSQGSYSGWVHVSKRYLDFFNTKTPKIKHRLYLNIDSTYLDKFAKIFTEKCMKEKLPFYYKYDEFASRADTFVIYSDTDNLLKYINILKEIEKENKEDIENHMHKPPIMTANINNWIGYGSEPQLKLDKQYSYSSIRVKVIKEVLDKFNKSWTNSHKNKMIDVNGNKVPYKEFLSELIYQTYINNYNKRIKYAKEEELDKVPSYQGYTLKDTTTESFRKELKSMIDQNINLVIENLDNLDDFSKNTKDKLVKMETRKKEYPLTIDKNIIKKTLKKQPFILATMNEIFYDQFRDAIKKQAEKYNISTENFSFDKEVLKELEQLKEEDKKDIKPKETPKPKITNLDVNRKTNPNETYKINKNKQPAKQPKRKKEILIPAGRIVINGDVHIGGNINIVINNGSIEDIKKHININRK